MRERDFHKELDYFLNKIKNNENFSLSRWGDGELIILEGNKSIDLRNVKNGEFKYDPDLDEYVEVRNKLIVSYTHQDNNYYIGIACPCCVGNEKYQYMKKKSNQNENNLTWANIFVNSNYNKFIKEYVEEFKNKKIIMIVNNNADIKKLSFDIENTYYVGIDAWYINYDLIQKIQMDIGEFNIRDTIYLIAAGPLANIMTYELWNYNKNNTYIDIGSVFDVQMGMKATRGYHMGAETLNKKCRW